MSESTPAALKASPRYLRSAVSQRADDAASGRITPTLAFAAGVLAEPPPLPPDDESSLPHAATPSASTAATAAQPTRLSFISAPPAGLRPGAGRDVRCKTRARRARRAGRPRP